LRVCLWWSYFLSKFAECFFKKLLAKWQIEEEEVTKPLEGPPIP
jgi:hypothetical protein